MRIFFILLLFTLYSLRAEDKYAVKSEGWQAWKHLEKTILTHNEEESLALCSGRMKEGIFKFGMENIVKETKSMQPSFIREFTNKAKDTLYLVTIIQERDTTLIFKKPNDTWLFDEQTPGNFTLPEEAEKWQEINILKAKLDQLGKQVAIYFTEQRDTLTIPPAEQLGVNPNFLKIVNPETQQPEKLLLVRGVTFKASSSLLLASTEKAVFGKYYACFEDGRVQTINKEFFDLNKAAFGMAQHSQATNYTPDMLKKLESILKSLAEGNYKDRKKARQEFTTLGAKVIPFLQTNQNHEDLETKLTIKEILHEIQSKSLVERPQFSEDFNAAP